MMIMKKIVLIICIILIVVATSVTCIIIDNDIFNPAAKHLKSAVKNYSSGRYEETIDDLEAVVSINDKLPTVYYAKASAEIHIDEETVAAETLLQAFKLQKGNSYDDNNRVCKILNDLFEDDAYQGHDELMLWWYEKMFDNTECKEYLEWLESCLTDKYKTKLEKIKQENENNSENLYGSILEEYKRAQENNYEYDYLNGEEFEDIYPHINPEIVSNGINSDLSYSVMDINGDGTMELVIAAVDGDNCTIYDMYTFDGEPKRLFDAYSMGYRTIYTIYEDGIIGYYSDGGMSGGSYTFCELCKTPYSGDNYVNQVVYLSEHDPSGIKGYYIARNGEEHNTEISEDEYKAEIGKYRKRQNFSWIKLNDYNGSDNASFSENEYETHALTEKEAAEKVIKAAKAYVDRGYKLGIESETEDRFVFKIYEETSEKQTVLAWFHVLKKTGEVIEA